MNERGQKAKHTVARHLQALRLVRARRAIRHIPASTPIKLAMRWKHYAIVATGQLGKKRLARVVWPWQHKSAPKPPPYQIGRWRRHQIIANPNRVLRGRPSNPTVLG